MNIRIKNSTNKPTSIPVPSIQPPRKKSKGQFKDKDGKVIKYLNLDSQNKLIFEESK